MSQTSDPIPITGEELSNIGKMLQCVPSWGRWFEFIPFKQEFRYANKPELLPPDPATLYTYRLVAEQIMLCEKGTGFRQQFIAEGFRLSDFVIVTPEAARAWRKLRCV